MRSSDAYRAAVGFVVLSLVACSPSATPISGGSAPDPSAPSTGATESPSPAPPSQASPSPSPEAAPPSEAGREWARLPDDPVFANASVQGFDVGDQGLFAHGYIGQPDTGVVEGAIWRSQDGRSWERVSGSRGFADAAVGSVAQGIDGSYVAAGTTCHFECGGARMWRSADGIEWTPLTGGVPDAWYIDAVATRLGWIVTGSSVDPAPPMLWTSVDGETWTRSTGLGRVPALVRGVVLAGGQHVAYGSAYPGTDSIPAVWTSTDGSTWTRVPRDAAPLGQVIMAVSEIDGLLTALVRDADGVELWTSEDGLAWQHRAGALAAFEIGDERVIEMFEVVDGGPGLIAFGTAETMSDPAPIGVWLSSDGVQWEPASDIAAFDGAQSVWAAVSYQSQALAVGALPCDLDCPQQATFWVSPTP